MAQKIDKFGHCIECGKQVITLEVIDNKISKKFTPDWAEHEYEMSDGSFMRVCMCKQCIGKVDKLNQEEIMEAVIHG